MVDAISDMLTRIRNAQNAQHGTVVMPASKLKYAIAKVLEEEGYILSVKKNVNPKNNAIAKLEIELAYDEVSHAKKEKKIKGIKQISKQGQRRYVRKSQIFPVRNGFGISIVSTSQGVMTGYNARKRGLGGEYICEVW